MYLLLIPRFTTISQGASVSLSRTHERYFRLPQIGMDGIVRKKRLIYRVANVDINRPKTTQGGAGE